MMEEMNLTPEQKKKMITDECICKGCPSWKECEGVLDQSGFCYEGIGKSSCITEEKGCICPDCPIYAKMKLTKSYYCTRDSEKSQLKV